MANTHNVTHTPLSIRYNGEEAIEARLPSGGCNYTNLSLGVNAARCGCKRFWDRSFGDASDHGGKTGFCMCEHHACYHDDVSVRDSEVLAVESSTPRQTSRTLEQRAQIGTLDAHIGVVSPRNAYGDSYHWVRNFNTSGSGLPPIPSQCLLPSDNGSVNSASQAGYYRPFGGRGLDTLNQTKTHKDASIVQPPRENSRMQIYEDRYGVQHLQSLTDVASPSLRASPGREVNLVTRAASAASETDIIDRQKSTQRSAPSQPVTADEASQLALDPPVDNNRLDDHEKQLVLHVQPLRETNDLPERVQDHEHRLEQLENVSFTHPAVEQLQDTHEHLEIRVGELEHRISDMETAQAAQDANSISTRPSIEGSFDSRISHTSAVIPHIELSRVEILEAQVAELQSIAPPTYSRPWELEVVFLPFGAQLMGIWTQSSSLTQNSATGGTGVDEWTQTQNSLAVAQARLTFQDRISTWESSTRDHTEEDTSWLMARACGVGSKVDRRLRSRGLVRTIQICGPDARDVQSAILKAFGEILEILIEDPFSSQDENVGEIPKHLRSYLGLQASWIPLRKLHKDSCLRFLNPTEMLTPALWTVPFLSSSVAMRHSATRRLYVTQRDSYMQHQTESLTDWTWHKIRQLPRVYPDSSSIDHTPEADAQEECWTFDARLDPIPSPQNSFHTSFHSEISQLSIDSLPASPELPEEIVDADPVSPSDHFSSAPASPGASTPRTSLPSTVPISPLRQRNPFRPAQRRTISVSSAIPLRREASPQGATQSSKRRVPSFARETQSSPSLQTNTLGNTNTSSSQPLRSLEITTKRRRISRSPSRPRNTPRWSMGSPSPFPVSEMERERGTTPFAYATPHSNVPYLPRSAGEVDVYEDEDDDADYFDRGDAKSEGESSTDEDELEDDEEGFEQNALSDFETDHGKNHERRPDVWQGVQEDSVGSHSLRYAGLVNQSFSNAYEPERQVEEELDADDDDGDDDDDAASDVSESPSEYPSTYPQLPQKVGVVRAGFVAEAKSTKRSGLYERRQKKEMGFTIHVDDEADADPV